MEDIIDYHKNSGEESSKELIKKFIFQLWISVNLIWLIELCVLVYLERAKLSYYGISQLNSLFASLFFLVNLSTFLPIGILTVIIL
jgi:uncharacterized membrane protein YecN with MAPEG domain